MSRVAYTTIGGGLIGPDRAVSRRYWWKERGTVAKQRTLYRRAELKALPGRSLLPQISDVWNALSDDVKSDWDYAANVMGLHAYNLFVQDKAYRIKNEIAGNADPSYYHQFKVGHLEIPEGAGDVLLRQTGTLAFSFPCTMRLRRKTVLAVDDGGSEFIKVRFNYEYDESGGELTQTDEIELNQVSGWDCQLMRITPHSGVIGTWTFEIETHDLKGDLYFDNFWIEQPVGIITADPYCVEVERYWNKILFPVGCVLETIYPVGGAL